MRRRLLPSAAVLAALLAATALDRPAASADAQQDKQAIAKELREAKSAHLLKSGVDPRLLDRFAKEVADWKRFTLTDDLKVADVIMTLSEEALEAKGGQRAPVMIVLTITRGVGGPALWTDKERSGVTTGSAANLVKRLKDGLQRADLGPLGSVQ